MNLSQRQKWIIFLYDELAKCETEEEAQHMVAIIDQEEAQMAAKMPPRGSLLDEILLKPYRKDDE